MKKRILIQACLIATLIVFFSAFSIAAVETPKQAIQTTIDSILETLRDKTLAQPSNKTKRRTTIKDLIRDRFDFTEMAKRILATHWKDRSKEERNEFISVFSDLLMGSYIAKIETYTNEKVTYDKEILKGKGKYGMVKTQIITANVNIPIDYKLIKKSKWVVYDVVIEGVSFVSTYRSQYNKIITGESYASLIKQMKQKLDKENKKIGA